MIFIKRVHEKLRIKFEWKMKKMRSFTYILININLYKYFEFLEENMILK